MALEAILAGGSWEQLPADDVLSLSHSMGNAALLELHAMRSFGPEMTTVPFPHSALATAPLYTGGGEPIQTEAPGFAAMSPIGGTAPVVL